jgi:hypothetical protein
VNTTFHFRHCFILACAASATLPVIAAGSDYITAVASRTSSDYVRATLSDGTFKPETYAFGNGGTWSGALKDFSMDKLTFLDVAHTLAYPLADKKYLPSKDPKTTELLIMVYWGTTHAPEHANESGEYQRVSNFVNSHLKGSPLTSKGYSSGGTAYPFQIQEQLTALVEMAEVENEQRDKTDLLNAKMLGYDSWWANTERYRESFFEDRRQDMIDELELNRYFVVLMAYDFQILWKEKKHKLLWETRFSVRQLHHEFDKDLPAMAQYASKFFGQDSHGLVHTAVPFGHVEIGDVKSLGEAPPK